MPSAAHSARLTRCAAALALLAVACTAPAPPAPTAPMGAPSAATPAPPAAPPQPGAAPAPAVTPSAPPAAAPALPDAQEVTALVGASDVDEAATARLAALAESNGTLAPALWLEVAERRLRQRQPREAADAAARGLQEGAAARRLKERLLDVRAQALAAVGDANAAFEANRQILALATSRATLGEQLYRLARASRDLGKRDEALRALRTAIQEFPNASTTADALRLLDELGASDQVDPYVLGRARYAVGDLRNAVAAFDTSLQANPNGPDAASARLYRSLAALVPSNEAAALAELDRIAGDPAQETEIAASALLEAGQALEGLNEPDQAEARYVRLVDRFPRLDAAATAGFRLGLLRYTRGAFADALSAWDALLARRADLASTDVSRAAYWRGRALARLGREPDARAAFADAAAVRPSDYYTLRALDARGELSASASTAADEAELRRWLSGRGVQLDTTPADLAQEAGLVRTRALAAAGLAREATWEAEEVAQRYADKPRYLLALWRAFGDAGLPSSQAGVGLLLPGAFSLESPLDAPVALRRMAYPRPFGSRVDTVSKTYGVDPLLLEATFREGSGFDPWANNPTSGARGLALMSPIQAEESASATGARGEQADLSKPDVAIEQQGWLVASRLRRFDGRPEVALAALGVGDRTVDGWLVRPGADDTDLFLERMDWEGVRAGVRSVLATRLSYAAAYGGGTPPLAARQPGPEPVPAAVKIARLMGDLPLAAPFSPPADVGTPEQRATFARGFVLQRDGDHAAAVDLYAPLVGDADPAVAAAARLRQAEALIGDSRPGEAVSLLGSGSPEPFLIGRALADAGRCQEALAAFDRAAATAGDPILGAQARAAQSGCLQRLGRDAEAVGLLDQAARTEGLPRLQGLAFRERLALAKVRAGDVAGARADLAALLNGARSASYRADLGYYLGLIAPTPAEQRQRFEEALKAAPKSRAAQSALDELVAVQAPTTALLEGAEARFEQSRYREALGFYDAFLRGPGAGSAQAADARYGRGVALVRLGQDRAGIAALQEIASTNASSPAAAEGLFRGGRVFESLAEFDAAVEAYRRVLALPGGGGARGDDARFRLAFAAYRRGAYQEATDSWRDLAGRRDNAEDKAQSLFWLGKALRAAGDAAGASDAWASARRADPGGFYALRAADLQTGGTGETPRAGAADRPVQAASPREDVRAWIASRGGNPDALEASLRADPALGRAERLLAWGLRQEASWELAALAESVGRDTSRLALLSAWEDERGLYNLELTNSFSLGQNTRTGPLAVRKLANPLPHPIALAQAAREQRADPLLFAGLMRQESALDQYVESSAQARGLTQLIASTAYEAARALGRTATFDTNQLFQPKTSLTFGTYTFARRLERYDGRIFPALAAYNATAYAVDGWLLAAGEQDIDVFAESIPFTETYPYVQRIYENYRQYQELYGAGR